MNMSLASVQQSALLLSTEERAALIDFLWDSLDPNAAERQRRWAMESEERIDAVDAGRLATVDGTEALRTLRTSPNA
jgi:putative addiction module component (TIGR02574 family)